MREQHGAVLVIFAQFLAQPSHRPIQVMQVEMLNAIDGVILAPAVGHPIGAAGEQAMQNGEKHRAFERKAVLAGTGEVGATNMHSWPSDMINRCSPYPVGPAS